MLTDKEIKSLPARVMYPIEVRDNAEQPFRIYDILWNMNGNAHVAELAFTEYKDREGRLHEMNIEVAVAMIYILIKRSAEGKL